MARTSRNGAPAASFDALDNIDIDDMFAEDGDDLFDGLDMDLDQMGDITNNLGTEGFDASLENENIEEVKQKAPEPAPAAEEQPTRRKTKRKSKAPSHLDDDTDEEPPQKKKKRNAKSAPSSKTKSTTKTTSKKKSTKKEKEETKSETKSKSKVKSLSMPPPVTRPPSSGPPTPNQGQVAAAGQFGGRQKNRHFALPLSRTTSEKGAKKTKTTKSSSSIASEAASSSAEKSKLKKGAAPTPPPLVKTTSEAPVAKAPAPFVPTNQNSFCGLKPSNTLFYPFMPALPAEPSIKNRKQYPVIDKINSSFMSFINASSSSNTSKPSNGIIPASETENIFRLMHDTLKDLNPSGGQTNPSASHADKDSAVSTAIGSLRQTVASMEKQKLAGDLFAVCALLKRQYDFLQQNLNNMEHWCKDNFSEAEYLATYGPPESQKKQKDIAAADSILSKFKNPLIKVKVKCGGFKEPKPGGLLFALLPQSVTKGAALGSTERDGKSTKKRKSSAADTAALSHSNIPALAEQEVVIKTYSELRPAKRRQLITELVAQTAKDLESNFVNDVASRRQAIERRHNELKKMVEEDEVLVIHTAAMWQYIDKAGYLSDFTEETLQDALRDVWSPDMKSGARTPSCHSLQPSRIRIQDDKTEAMDTSTGNLVFDRLHSLLVEELSDSDNDDDDDDVKTDSFDEDVKALDDNFDELLSSLPAGTTLPSELKIVDLSKLNLDERASMHLRKVGLMEDQPLPIETPKFPESISSRGANGYLGGNDDECSEDGLEDIVKNMSKDLLELNKVNDARASFLDTAARHELFKITRAKRQSDLESMLNAKCQQILKRSKDKLKSSKPKIATKEEQVLPW